MAVMVITASAFSIFVYSRVERRIDDAADYLLQLELTALLAEIDAHPGDPEQWSRFADEHLRRADPDVRLGIQMWGPDGTPEVANGSVMGFDPPLPKKIRTGQEYRVLEDLDFGLNYPFLALSGRADHGYAQVSVYSRIFARSAGRIREAFFKTLPILLLLTAGLGWWLSRGSLRPIAEITRTARRISTTHLDESIPTTGSGDELDQLANTLNEVLARIRGGVERVRRFSVDAAHQLRTPLAALQSQIDVTLAKERPAAEYQKVLEDLLAQVGALSDTVNAMLRLAQSEGGLDTRHLVPVEIGPLLEEVVDFFAPLAEEHKLELELRSRVEGAVEGDPGWLHQLFANLIDNAIRYTPEGGRVEVSAEGGEDVVRVRVRDTGVGIAEADRERVFARFERAGESPGERAGLGLGLTLAREIARAHGGSVDVESHPERGSVFTVRLPLASTFLRAERPRRRER
jgi:heavy metal sensor kinase